MEDMKETVSTEETQEAVRGDRGIVGQPSAALTLKQKWHEAEHELRDANDRNNPRKKEWWVPRHSMSLRDFARKLAKQNDPVALEWFANKKGAKNQSRTKENLARIALERTATKQAKRKKSQKSGSKSSSATTEAK